VHNCSGLGVVVDQDGGWRAEEKLGCRDNAINFSPECGRDIEITLSAEISNIEAGPPLWRLCRAV